MRGVFILRVHTYSETFLGQLPRGGRLRHPEPSLQERVDVGEGGLALILPLPQSVGEVEVVQLSAQGLRAQVRGREPGKPLDAGVGLVCQRSRGKKKKEYLGGREGRGGKGGGRLTWPSSAPRSAS